MTTTRHEEVRGRTARRIGLVLLISALLHAVVLLWVGPHLKVDVEPLEEREEFVVETRYETEPEPEPEPEPEIIEKEFVEVPEPPQPEPEQEPVPEPPLEEPEYREDEKQVAKAMDVIPPTPEEPQTTEPAPVVAEAVETEPEPEVAEAVQDPVILRPKPDARQLFMPDPKAYERMFAERDEDARERAETNRERNKKRLFAGHEQLTKNVRASLHSAGTEVRPGNHHGVNSRSPGFASYIGAMHRKIHERWANSYLMDLDLHEPAGSPMNNPQLNTKLEFVISAGDGSVEAVNIVQSSGQVRFDAQAIAIAHAVAPHPNPPAEFVSPDGKVYVHWNFWRDQRQCGPFGASIFIVDAG